MDVNRTSANISNWTFNERENVETYMGHRRIWGLTETMLITIIYAAIYVTGVIGNISVCIVIVTNKYMHTATNYYLFSLAVSDVWTLILGEFSCYVLHVVVKINDLFFSQHLRVRDILTSLYFFVLDLDMVKLHLYARKEVPSLSGSKVIAGTDRQMVRLTGRTT